MQKIPKPILTDGFTRAFEFASTVHAAQLCKGTTIPYVSHLLGVASLVLEHGGDEDCAIAALLRDAPEDQGGHAMLAQIEARFGERVGAMVRGCTDTFDEPKPPYGPRKEAYIAHLAHADRETCLVSAADKLHNARAILHDLRTLGESLWQRFSGSTMLTESGSSIAVPLQGIGANESCGRRARSADVATGRPPMLCAF